MNLNDKGGTVTYHVISELGKQYAQWVQTVCTEDVPNPGIKPASIVSLALVDGFFTTTATWEDPSGVLCLCNLQI